MNITNPYLYEETCRDHHQQMRRQITINRLAVSQRRMIVLQWIAHLLLKMGVAIRRYSEQQRTQMQNRKLTNERLLEEYHLSR